MKVTYEVFDKMKPSVYSRVQRFCRQQIEEGHDPEDKLEIYPKTIDIGYPDVVYPNMGKAAEDAGTRYRQCGIHYGPGYKLFNV